MNPFESRYWPDFMWWIYEREHVRELKESGAPPPWTNDPIIQNTRFCNVRREDDKVTRWIHSNWRAPNSHSPTLAFAMCVARVVNWPPTLTYLGYPHKWDPVEFIAKLDARHARGEKIWTSAYMVTGGYSPGGETKQEIMARVLSGAYINAARIRSEHSLSFAHGLITETRGLGTFLAAQVIADLKYTPLLEGAEDWWEFCAPGPGSTMGLNFLHGRASKDSTTTARFAQEVNEIRTHLKTTHGLLLSAHDVQNCLCEFSKYVRVKYMGGRAKNGFNADQSYRLSRQPPKPARAA